MTKEVHLTNEDGFVSTIDFGQTQLEIDGSGQETADTLDHLLGVYAACYVPAVRVGAEQRNVGDLGALEIDATGELNESDKLEAVAFDITVDADLDGEEVETIVERANALCKVGDAVKDSLVADVTINGHDA